MVRMVRSLADRTFQLWGEPRPPLAHRVRSTPTASSGGKSTMRLVDAICLFPDKGHSEKCYLSLFVSCPVTELYRTTVDTVHPVYGSLQVNARGAGPLSAEACFWDVKDKLFSLGSCHLTRSCIEGTLNTSIRPSLCNFLEFREKYWVEFRSDRFLDLSRNLPMGVLRK